MPPRKQQPPAAPPRKSRGRPAGEPRSMESLRLPERIQTMIGELARVLPTHPDGKRWTRTDVVCRAVEDLHRAVTGRAASGPTD